ncbi:lactoylglutathione lyase [Paenibacillus sp. yr247]|uniref:VOC family protein n=1 Tax=Paenibacillus sp. yr247 TaxID=1761880 RepID=UPI0008883E59|nr:VOC family protein [Paenibacillus sp. yr247]SDO33554.1 lactoylglutathione lyase [Paenibacillus sp. yr247]
MIKKVEHVAIIVKNIEKSIQYYSDMFGFTLRKTGKNSRREMAFLKLDNHPGFEIELILDIIPQGDYADKGIVNHLAFTVDNIQEAIQYYRGKGIVFHSVEPNNAFDGAKTIFFNGPNGELLQFVEPVVSLHP